MSSPIPAWVVSGPLGCGKTTLIARLLATKPPEENWAVLLNEFSEAGIDALTVAAAARGAYDVRMVPGGCICCVGEADFRRNLLELVAARERPARIIVEPSGIGHPAGIVEELLMHQAQGGLRLEAVIGLVDAARVPLLRATDAEPARATAEIADVLALSKTDLADASCLREFESLAGALYPAKKWFGGIVRGELPNAAWDAIRRDRHGIAAEARASQRRPAQHAAARAHPAHEHAAHVEQVGDAERRSIEHLGYAGASWTFPPRVAFSREALSSALHRPRSMLDPALGDFQRLKAVLRVAEDEWVLLQRVGDECSMVSTAWRRDQRIELIVGADQAWDVAAWDDLWRRCRRDA